MFSDALIKGEYRYTLTREWDARLDKVCWIMLNPSTADANHDDPTIRRCIAFSKLWGYGGIHVVNLFALRATNPKALYGHPDPIGPENDGWISFMHQNSARTVCAWGVHGDINARGHSVMQRMGNLWHLGMTKGGCPRHPLYIKGDQPLIAWTAATPTPQKQETEA